MIENLVKGSTMWPYIKRGLIACGCVGLLGCGLLIIKGPSIAKNMARVSLEKSLNPLGIQQINIESINFGWGRLYFRDIRSQPTNSAPSLTIQEMDVAISPFFKVKAIDIVGATLELKDTDKISFSQDNIQNKLGNIGKFVGSVKQKNLPSLAMRDCLLILPSSHGSIKLPLHAVTETTVTRNRVLTVDLGEAGGNNFSGQLVLDVSRKGTVLDVHTTNLDIKTPTFQIIAPEVSFRGSTGSEGEEGCKIDGFAKLNQLKLDKYGSLKVPLEVNLEGEGTPDYIVFDELRVQTLGKDKDFLELEGNYKPSENSGQLILTTQINQLANLWDFTPLIAGHDGDKVAVSGKVNLTSELFWDKGSLKTSVLALNLKGGSVKRDGFSLEGATTQVLFNTLKPLTTKGAQRLSATKLTTSGIDLSKVAFECLFDATGLFQIKKFTAETLSGTIKAHQFKRIEKPAGPSFQFETDFDNIELADILKLTDLKTLSGRAKLAGNASMSYDLQGGLDVNQAELHSISDTGLIQYQPGEGKIDVNHLGQGGASMAFQVLDNLNFTVFNVRLEHLPENPAEMQGIVKMLGSNPKVLNGYPFEFNIVTTGKLKDLVINTLHHMKPPTDLGELNQAIKETKAAKALEKEKLSKASVAEVQVAKETSSEESAEAKAPKISLEGAQNLDFKVTQATHEQKVIKKPRIAKRAKAISVRKKLKSRKKIKRVRAVKTFKDKNRKIING